MKHPCSSVSELLEKYLDQEVTDQEKALVEAHLFDCSSCRGTLKSMEELSHVMKVPLDEIAREEEFDRVWLKVRREIQSEEKHSWREVFRSWLSLPTLHQKRIWIPAVAAAVILIVTMGPFLFKESPSYPTPSVVEYVESDTNNVMIYESEKGSMTVIWILDEPEAEPST